MRKKAVAIDDSLAILSPRGRMDYQCLKAMKCYQMKNNEVLKLQVSHTHTHTHIYIYIYIYEGYTTLIFFTCITCQTPICHKHRNSLQGKKKKKSFIDRNMEDIFPFMFSLLPNTLSFFVIHINSIKTLTPY